MITTNRPGGSSDETIYIMTTEEIAELTETKYFIEYVSPVDPYWKKSFYYQLVRTKDCAIIFSNADLQYIFSECWKMDIQKDDVTIW